MELINSCDYRKQEEVSNKSGWTSSGIRSASYLSFLRVDQLATSA
jgi:hypothetical protein